MDETRRLAAFAAELTFDDLPAEVIDTAKSLLLDQIGCQVAFASLPWSKDLFDYVRSKPVGGGTSTIAYYGLKADAEDAALVTDLRWTTPRW